MSEEKDNEKVPSICSGIDLATKPVTEVHEATIERTEPWIAEGIIALLDIFFEANRSARVLETGMGGSTIYFEKRSRMLVSIEHDQGWFFKIANKFFQIVDMRMDDESQFLCTNYLNFHLANKRPYHQIIDKIPDNFFDLILIDGRDRVKCIRSAIPKLKPGGWLVLDNSEREYYQPGMDMMKDWNRIDSKQNRPDKYGFTYPDWTTSIFKKP
jgi:predicted O-methyltransferase YrrM